MRRVDESHIQDRSNHSRKVFWMWARQYYMMMLNNDWKYQLACEELLFWGKGGWKARADGQGKNERGEVWQ